MHDSAVAATGRALDSAIHDIGYRRYEGALLGAVGAWRSLYWQGLRAMFGFGRSAKAKIVPVFVLVATLLPALATLTVASATKGAVPIRYAALIAPQLIMYVLFVAAQAPEILSRDQQYRLLPLVLTRHVTRNGYATARFAALLTAVLIIALLPSMLLYIGSIGAATDPAAEFKKVGDRIWPLLTQSSLSAWVMAGIAGGLAAWTPRRAYATAAIIGLFLVTGAVAAGLSDLGGSSSRTTELVSPGLSLTTQAMVLFDEKTRSMETRPPLDIWNYVAFHASLGAAGLALMVLRLRRVRV